MSMNELEAKVAELRELRRMAEELAGEIAATEDALKAYMAANSTDELYGPSFKITWKESKYKLSVTMQMMQAM